MEIRRLNRDDRAAVLAAQDLFDGPADQAATERFLSACDHYLLVP